MSFVSVRENNGDIDLLTVCSHRARMLALRFLSSLRTSPVIIDVFDIFSHVTRQILILFVVINAAYLINVYGCLAQRMVHDILFPISIGPRLAIVGPEIAAYGMVFV